MRWLDIQSLFVSMESICIKLGNLGGCLAFFASLSDNFVFSPVKHLLAHMSYIGNVLDMLYAHTTIFKDSPQPVGHGKCAQIANVNVAVNSGTARIHTNTASL